jgi:hypothetical protein
MTSKLFDISNLPRSQNLRAFSLVTVFALVWVGGCATQTNYVKQGGDYSTDSSQCNQELVNAELTAKDSVKPNELNTPQSLQYKNPFESCMVSKGWTPEKTELRLNTIKMTW